MARYGLASAPGRRHSKRHISGWSARTMARTAQERFSTPHVALTGATLPGTSRLYELMVGLSKSEAAGRCSITPAIADRNTAGRVRRLVGGRLVGGRLVGGRLVGGRLVGGRLVGGRLVGRLLPTCGQVARRAGGADANAFCPS